MSESKFPLWRNSTEEEDKMELKDALDWVIEKKLLIPRHVALGWYDPDTVILMYRSRNEGYYMYPYGITTEEIDEQAKIANVLIDEILAENLDKEL